MLRPLHLIQNQDIPHADGSTGEGTRHSPPAPQDPTIQETKDRTSFPQSKISDPSWPGFSSPELTQTIAES